MDNKLKIISINDKANYYTMYIYTAYTGNIYRQVHTRVTMCLALSLNSSCVKDSLHRGW